MFNFIFYAYKYYFFNFNIYFDEVVILFLIIKKKTLITYCIFLLLALSFIFSYASLNSESNCSFDGKTVIIDAGHGGIDGGAVGKGGSYEKELNLKMAKELEKSLKNAGYTVIMTRKDDTLHGEGKNIKKADTKYRLKIGNENPNALFLSIHMNSFTDAASKGSQIFYSVKNPQSKEFALLLRESLKKHADPQNERFIKEAYNSIYIMKNIDSPAVLIECGFLSNRSEEKLLNTPEYRANMIKGIVSAVNELKDRLYKSLPISQV